MSYKIDLAGKRFGKLVVIEFSYTGKGRKSYWKCRCDCGNEKVVSGSNLSSGNTSSCGCGEIANRQRLMKNFTEEHLKHGLAYSRIHRIWSHMKERCENEKCKDYELYGGRGISVCDEWASEEGFEKFYDWAILNGYNDNLSIDRIDTNGDYTPDNCRWSNATAQANNRRTNRYITIDCETKTLAEWCKLYDKNYATVYYRINRMGMNPKDALEK